MMFRFSMKYRYVPIRPMATNSPEKIRITSLCRTPIFKAPPAKMQRNRPSDVRRNQEFRPTAFRSIYFLILEFEPVELRLERLRLLLERLYGHVHFDGHIDVVLRDFLDLVDGIADLLRAQALLRGGAGDLGGLPGDLAHPFRRLGYPFASFSLFLQGARDLFYLVGNAQRGLRDLRHAPGLFGR